MPHTRPHLRPHSRPAHAPTHFPHTPCTRPTHARARLPPPQHTFTPPRPFIETRIESAKFWSIKKKNENRNFVVFHSKKKLKMMKMGKYSYFTSPSSILHSVRSKQNSDARYAHILVFFSTLRSRQHISDGAGGCRIFIPSRGTHLPLSSVIFRERRILCFCSKR